MTDQVQADAPEDVGAPSTAWRARLRSQALDRALAKRAAGAVTFTVAEAAALLSVSQEYLHRLISHGAFPAVHMAFGGRQGRYVVPAQAIDGLMAEAAETGTCVDAAATTTRDGASPSGGGA